MVFAISLENGFHMRLNPTSDQGLFNIVINRRTLEPEIRTKNSNFVIFLLSLPGPPSNLFAFSVFPFVKYLFPFILERLNELILVKCLEKCLV